MWLRRVGCESQQLVALRALMVRILMWFDAVLPRGRYRPSGSVWTNLLVNEASLTCAVKTSLLLHNVGKHAGRRMYHFSFLWSGSFCNEEKSLHKYFGISLKSLSVSCVLRW